MPYALYAESAANQFSGDYNDLSNRPTIPQVPENVSAFTNDVGYITAAQAPAQVNADWNATSGAAQILNKPTIPAAANDATLTIQMNGTTVGTFSANAVTNATINVQVPTNISELTNDAGYVSNAHMAALNQTMVALNQTIVAKNNRIDSLNNIIEVLISDSSLVPGQIAITTNEVADVTFTTATAGGNITDDGGSMVTVRGVCWSTSQNPTIADSHTTDGSGTGGFTSSITGLEPNTTYYVRAYATNSVGTAYGNQVSFTTEVNYDGHPCPGTPTVTDHQGNVYNTVLIGSQCWTKENMRCTTSPSTGTSILETSLGRYSSTGKKAYYPYGDASNVATYGLLYNWNAAVDTFNTAYGETSTNNSSNNAVVVTFSGNHRGICPQGWHLPSDTEWTQLEIYVGSQSQYVCDNDNRYVAKALASTSGWDTDSGICVVGNTPSNNNATGFSALPAGYYDGGFYNFGFTADFWLATQYLTLNAYYSRLASSNAFVRCDHIH